MGFYRIFSRKFLITGALGPILTAYKIILKKVVK